MDRNDYIRTGVFRGKGRKTQRKLVSLRNTHVEK